MSYKNELAEKIEKSGRKRIWISNQLGVPRTTFWRKANNDTFTDEEKSEINKLLL